MAKLDERGMASVFALAAVLLMLSGTAALFLLSGHNRLAAKEAVQTTRLVEAARSAVRLSAAHLERDGLDAPEVEGVIVDAKGGALCYRAKAERISLAEPQKAAYRLTAMSWQPAGERPDPKDSAAVGGKRAYAAALYRLEGTRMVFVRWEK